MALTITSYIASMTTQWNGFCADLWECSNQLAALGDAIKAQNWLSAHTCCDNASAYIQLALGHWWDSSGTTVHRYVRDCLNKINNDWTSGGAVTMDSILNAMLTAKYEELQKFIGIEDAYRSAIWDQPFNAQFYAALANGFRP